MALKMLGPENIGDGDADRGRVFATIGFRSGSSKPLATPEPARASA